MVAVRWFDNYAVRHEVEARFQFDNGPRWVRGFVSRKTETGFPVVTVALARGATTLVIDRKRDIRRPVAP